MTKTEDLLICTACGTQFDVPADQPLKNCKICDDPRQFVPPTGQSWTSLRQMKEKDTYKNKIIQDDINKHMWSIYTEPKFAIGERAIFLQTPHGNVLWDLITWLDDETVEFIKEKGGLKAIVISHPHFYTTHLHWAERFGCPVYMSVEDEEWLSRDDPKGQRSLIKGPTEDIIPGITAVKLGGHFPGSLVLHWAEEKKLLIADTLLTIPSAYNPRANHIAGQTNSYAFMWSIPNFIPLPPSTILQMWQALKPFDFNSTHGVFIGTDIREGDVKARVLESMKIQARAEGYNDQNAPIFWEEWP